MTISSMVRTFFRRWQKFFAEGCGRLHPHRFMGDTLATIQQTLGAIGCVTWSPMLEQQSTVVGLCNASGAFVFPSVEGGNAAGASLVTAMEKEVHPDTLVTAQEALCTQGVNNGMLLTSVLEDPVLGPVPRPTSRRSILQGEQTGKGRAPIQLRYH